MVLLKMRRIKIVANHPEDDVQKIRDIVDVVLSEYGFSKDSASLAERNPGVLSITYDNTRGHIDALCAFCPKRGIRIVGDSNPYATVLELYEIPTFLADEIEKEIKQRTPKTKHPGPT